MLMSIDCSSVLSTLAELPPLLSASVPLVYYHFIYLFLLANVLTSIHSCHFFISFLPQCADQTEFTASLVAKLPAAVYRMVVVFLLMNPVVRRCVIYNR